MHHFGTTDELRRALLAFRDTHTTTRLIGGHGYITPKQFRQKLVPVPAKVA